MRESTWAQKETLWRIHLEMNNFSGAKRKKNMIDKFGIISDLCTKFDKYSGKERKKHLVRYLKSFAHRDAIPENYYEDPEDDNE